VIDENEYKIRYTEEGDAPFLKSWLEEEGVLKFFPMCNEKEIDDSIRHWISFSRLKSSLTVLYKGEPCGMTTLYLMPYKKVAHQALLSIIVSEAHRGKGVGTLLLNNLIHLAKNYFYLDQLYLEVYEGNPAIHLYKRFGFQEVGVQHRFIKELDGTFYNKIIMERAL
jgi:putative acetyltransferase